MARLVTSSTEEDAVNEQRDEIARIVLSSWGVTSLAIELADSRVEFAFMAADALLAAGLVVPSGLTAKKLRVIAYRHSPAQWFGEDDQIRDEKRMLRAWADALSTQETAT